MNLDEKIEELREILRRDRGDLEVVDFKDGILKIRLLGMCTKCPFSQITLSEVIKKKLKEVPEVKEIEVV
ncbi:MAG: hypothetical protein B6U88_00280 [Candidatus Aenigmarchaeota archaeon ex4484_56]|nr:MAG: hypothetical protein B6U88_00280 [Candidatus Aenigmarchaeota archaeon ex4484_56]